MLLGTVFGNNRSEQATVTLCYREIVVLCPRWLALTQSLPPSAAASGERILTANSLAGLSKSSRVRHLDNPKELISALLLARWRLLVM